MNRFKKVIRNIIILMVLVYIFFSRSGLYFSPISAHQHSERSIHYGPSKVVHVENFEKGKYMLSKYDKWISCNTVNRKLFFFWSFGNQVTGFRNDKNKKVDYTWGASSQNYRLYGIINDDRVKKIEITLDNGNVLKKTKFHSDLFLFTWKENNKEGIYFENIKGYDKDNNIIFEDKY